MPQKCWSRDYFPKNEATGRFDCVFCSESYKDGDGVKTFKRHLLVSYTVLDLLNSFVEKLQEYRQRGS